MILTTLMTLIGAMTTTELVITGIAGLIAAGCVMYAISVTLNWLAERIEKKLALRNAKKTVVGDLGEIIKTCKNVGSLGELKRVVEKGYTHTIATLDNNDKVVDVEVIRDESTVKDKDVAQLINRTGEGMVVIMK